MNVHVQPHVTVAERRLPFATDIRSSEEAYRPRHTAAKNDRLDVPNRGSTAVIEHTLPVPVDDRQVSKGVLREGGNVTEIMTYRS
jgi:hypothetical protein